MLRETLLLFCVVCFAGCALAQEPELILHHGKIVTVDERFTIAEAIAVRGGRVLSVGANSKILALQGPGTELVDLGGKMVLPGLIDCHAHPLAASTIEF